MAELGVSARFSKKPVAAEKHIRSKDKMWNRQNIDRMQGVILTLARLVGRQIAREMQKCSDRK